MATWPSCQPSSFPSLALQLLGDGSTQLIKADVALVPPPLPPRAVEQQDQGHHAHLVALRELLVGHLADVQDMDIDT